MKMKCLEHPHKKRHNTQQEAETSLLLLDNKNLRIYKCDSCNGWHLTSKIEKKMTKTWREGTATYHKTGDSLHIVYDSGIESYWVDNIRHREDGYAYFAPAYNGYDEIKRWYYQGEKINCETQEQFERLIKMKVFW